MNYIRKESNEQLAFTHSADFFMISPCIYSFLNDITSVKTTKYSCTVFEVSPHPSEKNLIHPAHGYSLGFQNYISLPMDR